MGRALIVHGFVKLFHCVAFSSAALLFLFGSGLKEPLPLPSSMTPQSAGRAHTFTQLSLEVALDGPSKPRFPALLARFFALARSRG